MIFFASVPAGCILGIPIRIHWSAPAGILVFALISWPRLNSRGFDVAVWRMAAALAGIAIVASLILMHELAHSLVAGIWRVRTHGIYLHICGGLALVMDPLALSLKPWQQMAIFGAGPASNLVCFGATGLLACVVHGRIAVRMLAAIAALNLGIASFNLLPIWPLDGGQLFRAFLALMRLRSRLADLLTLFVSLLIGCPFAYIAWIEGYFWAFTILALLLVIAVIVLWFLGTEPDTPKDPHATADAPMTGEEAGIQIQVVAGSSIVDGGH
jgi:Zn-dependent protease